MNEGFDMSAGAAAGAAAAAAAIAQAIKASGVIVRVEPIDFLTILQRQEEPLVIHSTSGFFGTTYNYLTSYKGLAFFAKSSQELDLPTDTELIRAKAIWIPGG
jgi:ABC-type transport system substrate-binding protein